MKVFLGVEFGSTRIKAVAIDEKGKPLASGAHDWENRLIDGIWTYHLRDVWAGLQDSVRGMIDDYEKKSGTPVPEFCGIGISAMMHGYIALSADDTQLAPFRTWRNTMTEESAELLSKTFGFNIPQRWTIAHLHQAITSRETHVNDISYLTTLAGYVHYRLTGQKVVGVGEASGIFPIDSNKNDYNEAMMSKFDEIANNAKMPWKLRDILPKVLNAGEDAGTLTDEGAKLIDPAGKYIKQGTPLCPPEGDAGTGMIATNAILPGTGNVSAGTSIFAMIVLDKALKSAHPQIDMVTTPAGKPVAMVHGANCSADLDAWVGLIHNAAELTQTEAGKNTDTTIAGKSELYGKLYNTAINGSDKDCGGIVSVGYLSGEHMTGFNEGRPLMVRTPEAKLTLGNLMRSLLFSAMTTLRIGVDILVNEEGVSVAKLLGHGGLFKTPVVAQKLMAGALGIPVAVMDSAGEGGAWGIALLAAYRVVKEQEEGLESFLEKKIFASANISVIEPDPEDVDGFNTYLARFKKALEVEKTAINAISD